MTKRWSAWAVALMLCVAAIPAFAQFSARPQQGQGYGPNYIPDGTRFVVVLDDKLDTSKLSEGKQFKVKLGEDLVAPNGDMVPRGKKLKGHISRVDKGFHGGLMMSFDQIDTRHGWVPVAATVVDVPGEHSVKANGEGEISKTGIGKKRTAEGALAGAAVGAGTGAIAGGTHGAIIGAAAGAAVGGTAAILTDRTLKLNKGQQLELQLDRPLQVPSH
jgi:hypothetical protein